MLEKGWSYEGEHVVDGVGPRRTAVPRIAARCQRPRDRRAEPLDARRDLDAVSAAHGGDVDRHDRQTVGPIVTEFEWADGVDPRLIEPVGDEARVAAVEHRRDLLRG